ncbi:hypothetical protein KOY49_00330 [Candidatus Minimicrobia vallesae]|uniref:Uncharacterized protein n=1 Tax=Candidatus Minimicrobia vallesae TaxID=2841264 RepID=A0A8F1MAF1_9BACT|nr:hypothetical protein [Candidatus Minimicrobia vallesae]QWQ31480.1 hypothetical protein KOY49_00330 [Candidatus Minimicrobia vallesae]
MLAGLAASEKSQRRWLAAVSGEMLDDDNARQLIGYIRKNPDGKIWAKFRWTCKKSNSM